VSQKRSEKGERNAGERLRCHKEERSATGLGARSGRLLLLLGLLVVVGRLLRRL